MFSQIYTGMKIMSVVFHNTASSGSVSFPKLGILFLKIRNYTLLYIYYKYLLQYHSVSTNGTADKVFNLILFFEGEKQSPRPRNVEKYGNEDPMMPGKNAKR